MHTQRIFDNPEFGSIRTLEIASGKILFCGVDVAHALGYSNARDAIRQHCKKDTVVKYDGVDSKGRKKRMTFLTEGNVYRLITHSKLPNAEKFESWLFDEVLPVLRANKLFMQDPTEWVKLLTYQKEYGRIKSEQMFSENQQKEIAGSLATVADNTSCLIAINDSIAQMNEVVKRFSEKISKNSRNEESTMQKAEFYDKEEVKSRFSEYVANHLQKDKNGFSICPSCGSGTHQNGTPALKIYPDHGYCHSCGFDGINK